MDFQLVSLSFSRHRKKTATIWWLCQFWSVPLQFNANACSKQMLRIAAKCLNFEIQIAHIVTRCVGDRIGSILELNEMSISKWIFLSHRVCHFIYASLDQRFSCRYCLAKPFVVFFCAVVVVDVVVIETNIHLRAHLLYFANWIPKRIGSLICKKFEIQRISIKTQSTCIPSKLFVTHNVTWNRFQMIHWCLCLIW